MVSILDLDIVILLVLFEESLVGILDVVLGRLLHVDGVDSIDSVVTVISENRAANDLFLEELFDVDSLSSVSSAFPGLVEQFFHLVIHRVVSEDSTGEVDEHSDLEAVVHINRCLVAGPDVKRGLSDLVLEALGLLIELGVSSNLEISLVTEKVLDHNIQKLNSLNSSAATRGKVAERDRTVVGDLDGVITTLNVS